MHSSGRGPCQTVRRNNMTEYKHRPGGIDENLLTLPYSTYCTTNALIE